MHKFHPSILRAYDIRGIIDKTLNIEDAYFIGRSFATFLKSDNKKTAAVGYDGRESSPDLKESLIRGLCEGGIDVVEIGLGPTPMLYFSVYHLEVDAGVMITGSHNPANYNGFKFMLSDRPFYGDDILQLGAIAEKGDFANGDGDLRYEDIIEDYTDKLADDCDLESESGLLDELDDFLEDEKKWMRIAWDIGNGATGEVMEELIDKIKAKHFLLFEKIDGTFPNHHPDPTVEKNLEDLKRCVADNYCDLGIAFDGDGDRIGVIDDQGEALWGDELMCLFAKNVLAEYPGSTIIADVKASQTLFDKISQLGGQPLMWKTGHSLIKAKMKETKAPLAGEMSGHIFFADRYYGFDDAIYAAIRLINIVLEDGRPLSQIRKEIAKSFSTPEIRIDCSEEEKFTTVDQIKAKLRSENRDFNDVDGLRVSDENGWWLLRASNTQSVLVARCEGKSEEDLKILKQNLKEILPNNIATPPELC